MPLMHATPDALELYALDKLRGPDRDAFEEHILVCEICQSALESVELEIEVLRQGLKEFELEARTRTVEKRMLSGKFILFRPRT